MKKIFVISGPSGSGKTALLKKLFRSRQIREKFFKIPTFTTRKPRKGERNFLDYCFLTKEEFLRLKRKKFFLESKKYLEDFYGTPKDFLKKTGKKFPLLCIDVEGALKIKKKFKDKAVLVFIQPPSSKVLEARLRKRRTEPEEILKKRLRIAKKEVKYAKKYKYRLTNQNLDKTKEELKRILLEEVKGL